MIKKYTAFGREFEGSPVRFKGVDGFELSSPSLHVQSGEKWKGILQKYWCPKHVFKLLYTEVK
tara:strand:- start:113 stop:301 length:189 start_codon:yes stop_codon:yes gene_type:complete